MKYDEFRQIVDRDLSGLVWDEGQRRRVLSAMNGEERPIMKKKAYTALILAALLIFGTLTALAATGGLSTIVKFFGNPPEYLQDKYHIINEADIVQPISQHCDSQWLDCEASELYWAENGLYITTVVRAKEPSMVAVEHSYFSAGATIPCGGTDMTWWDFRRQEGLTILRYQITSWENDASGTFAGKPASMYFDAHDGTNSIVVLRINDLDEADAALLSAGGTITLPLRTEMFDGRKLSTLDKEFSSLTIEFPPMTMQGGVVRTLELP